MPNAIASHGTVDLREVTAENLRAVLDLEVAPDQTDMVAPNDRSVAKAHYNEHSWFRSIYAGDTPVGFVMLYDDTDKPEYYLWRFMIDAAHQGNGYGRRAMEQLIDYVRCRPGATELLVSYVPIAGGPRDFYAGLGFRETGQLDGGEVLMRLVL